MISLTTSKHVTGKVITTALMFNVHTVWRQAPRGFIIPISKAFSTFWRSLWPDVDVTAIVALYLEIRPKWKCLVLATVKLTLMGKDRTIQSSNYFVSVPAHFVDSFLKDQRSFRSRTKMMVMRSWKIIPIWLGWHGDLIRLMQDAQLVCKPWRLTRVTEQKAFFAKLYAAYFAKLCSTVRKLSRSMFRRQSRGHFSTTCCSFFVYLLYRCQGCEYSFKCVVMDCSSRFREARDLYLHVRTAHVLQWELTGTRQSYQLFCPICLHVFNNSAILEHLHQ